MSNMLHQKMFGPYKIIHQIGDAHGASRFVMLCTKSNTNYTLYRFDQLTSTSIKKNYFQALVQTSKLDHPHILKVISVSYDDQSRLCVVTPYTGNHDGLVCLDELLQRRDGRLNIVESARAIEHMLDASKYAASMHLCNGPLETEDILVDRYGCLQIQMYGLSEQLRSIHNSVSVSSNADEVRSIIAVGYKLMTGIEASDGRIQPSALVKKLDKLWDRWFEIGLNPIYGFDTADDAIKAMPTQPGASELLASKPSILPQIQIGSMLRRRFKTADRSYKF